MNRIRLILFLLFLDFCCKSLYAQTETRSNYHASLEAQGVLTNHNYVPFWLRSDQFGSVPLPGASASFIGAARKDYDSTESMPDEPVSGMHTRLVDWGASLELRGDFGQQSRATLIEGYAKLRVSIFELKAGRVKDFMGLVDTTLSSGAFSQSSNALGIPKVQLAIPEFWDLPFFNHLLAVKGNFVHGWIGKTRRHIPGTFIQDETYFHQSSFYGRLGRPDWRLKLFGGFNHNVFWGYQKYAHDNNKTLPTWRTFEYVVIGKTYGGSKVGNHLGSIDLKMEYDFDNTRLALYHQFFYDKGGLSRFANIKDGLTGISLLNTNAGEGGFQWHKGIFELFFSKDQGGYPTSKLTNSGDEDYYNNNEFVQGWSYKGVALGNPFITPFSSTKTGLPHDTSDFFNNNRVVAFYTAFQGSVNEYQFTTKLSYSLNYGTFGTSQWGHHGGNHWIPPRFGIWKEVRQFSAYLEVQREITDGWQAGVVAALDAGDLFYNSGGLILKLKKSF
jgi:hypothetical protein